MPFIDHPQLLCDYCGKEIIPDQPVYVLDTRVFTGTNAGGGVKFLVESNSEVEYYHKATDCLRKKYGTQVR